MGNLSLCLLFSAEPCTLHMRDTQDGCPCETEAVRDIQSRTDQVNEALFHFLGAWHTSQQP